MHYSCSDTGNSHAHKFHFRMINVRPLIPCRKGAYHERVGFNVQVKWNCKILRFNMSIFMQHCTVNYEMRSISTWCSLAIGCVNSNIFWLETWFWNRVLWFTNLINGSHKFKHCFETRFWNAQKGAIQNRVSLETRFLKSYKRNSDLEHGLNDVTMIEIEKPAPCLTFSQGTSCTEWDAQQWHSLREAESKKNAPEKTLINALL